MSQPTTTNADAKPKIAVQAAIRMELGAPDVSGPDGITLLFAPGGQSLCAGWQPEKLKKVNGRYVQPSYEFRLFDLQGKQIPGAEGANQPRLLRGFAPLAWRALPHCLQFVTNAASFLFAADFSWGIRVFEVELSATAMGCVRIECCALNPAKECTLLWSKEVNKAFGCYPIAVVDASGQQVLFVLGGTEGVILSRNDGHEVRRFTLGHIETEAEAARRGRKFGMDLGGDDVGLYFSGHQFAYYAPSHLLAIGAFHDKRVRVLDISSAASVVFEANSDVNPARPRGGFWEVRRVEFVSGGNYLVAAYYFAGRGTRVSIASTEIFETHTWKRVWSEEDSSIGSVTLSPDGRLLAYIRDNAVEIMPFNPSPPQTAPR